MYRGRIKNTELGFGHLYHLNNMDIQISKTRIQQWILLTLLRTEYNVYLITSVSQWVLLVINFELHSTRSYYISALYKHRQHFQVFFKIINIATEHCKNGKMCMVLWITISFASERWRHHLGDISHVPHIILLYLLLGNILCIERCSYRKYREWTLLRTEFPNGETIH